MRFLVDIPEDGNEDEDLPLSAETLTRVLREFFFEPTAVVLPVDYSELQYDLDNPETRMDELWPSHGITT